MNGYFGASVLRWRAHCIFRNMLPSRRNDNQPHQKGGGCHIMILCICLANIQKETQQSTHESSSSLELFLAMHLLAALHIHLDLMQINARYG